MVKQVECLYANVIVTLPRVATVCPSSWLLLLLFFVCNKLCSGCLALELEKLGKLYRLTGWLGFEGVKVVRVLLPRRLPVLVLMLMLTLMGIGAQAGAFRWT